VDGKPITRHRMLLFCCRLLAPLSRAVFRARLIRGEPNILPAPNWCFFSRFAHAPPLHHELHVAHLKARPTLR